MLFDLFRDYVLLAIGVTFGLLLSGLCHVAAEADRRIEKMKEEHHEPGNFR